MSNTQTKRPERGLVEELLHVFPHLRICTASGIERRSMGSLFQSSLPSFKAIAQDLADMNNEETFRWMSRTYNVTMEDVQDFHMVLELFLAGEITQHDVEIFMRKLRKQWR